MMKLVLSEEEGMLRSVGDAPNGVLAVATPEEGATLVIDHGFDPSEVIAHGKPGHVAVQANSTPTGMLDSSTPITPEEAFAACASGKEANYLLVIAQTVCRAAVDAFAPYFRFEIIQSHLELATEIRDAAVEAGYLSAGPVDDE